MIFLTSRTAVLTYQDCPRRRYLAFHYNNHGITGSKLSLDLLIGTITHRGLQNLLEHSRVEHDGDTRTLERTCINQSVEVARILFFSLIENSNGIAMKSDDYTDLQYKIEEAWAICEALIRSYALWRLPQFGEFYEVLEVEKEEEFYLSDEILFQAKADGLLRGRQDNKLYVLSFKTARDFTDLTMKQILHDMQGMSEIAAIENRLNKEYKQYFAYRLTQATNNYEFDSIIRRNSKEVISHFDFCFETGIEVVECHAVQYEYLLKGRYQQDPWNSGIYKWQNPLIHCWKNCGVTGMFSNTNVGLDYKWKAGKGRQPQGWEKISVWQDMGVEQWIDKLLLHEIQPEEGDVFQNLFRSETINRDRQHIEEWRVSTLAQEKRIKYALDILNEAASTDAITPAFDAVYFPKHTNRCHDFWGNDCPFVQICHENVSPDELLEAGVMKIREPHHKSEHEEFQKKGFVK